MRSRSAARPQVDKKYSRAFKIPPRPPPAPHFSVDRAESMTAQAQLRGCRVLHDTCDSGRTPAALPHTGVYMTWSSSKTHDHTTYYVRQAHHSSLLLRCIDRLAKEEARRSHSVLCPICRCALAKTRCETMKSSTSDPVDSSWSRKEQRFLCEYGVLDTERNTATARQEKVEGSTAAVDTGSRHRYG